MEIILVSGWQRRQLVLGAESRRQGGMLPVSEISRLFGPISAEMGSHLKIAIDFTGYSCESARIEAVWTK